MILTFFLIIIGIFISSSSLLLLYFKFKANFKIWDKLNVINISPNIPFGNLNELIGKSSPHFGICYKNLYDQLKIVSKLKYESEAKRESEANTRTESTINEYAGIYILNIPNLFVIGPEFVKTILVRDFNSFINRGVYYNARDDPISNNIFFNENNEWRLIRQKLSFAFTSGKMKLMFETLNEVSNQLIEYIRTQELTREDSCDFKELMAGFTTDVVSSCIFGLQSNSLINPKSEFRKYSKKVMNFSKLKMLAIFMATSFPNLAKRLHFTVFNKESTEFFRRIVQQTVRYRRENKIRRKDLMQILIDLMEDSSSGDNGEMNNLSFDEIVANVFIFFFAGFETSSTTLSVTMYYLALNPEIQENLRKEIDSILNEHALSYESLNEMHLLDRVVAESMRMHPPVATLHRITNKVYQLPNGSEIPKGTPVIIPILGLHYDSDIWNEPTIFNPDRFKHEECKMRHHYAYLPFGEGNRICIGQRFALMQIKVGIIKILRHFRIEVSKKTTIPLKIDSLQASYIPKDLFLKISKLNKDEIISTEL